MLTEQQATQTNQGQQANTGTQASDDASRQNQTNTAAEATKPAFLSDAHWDADKKAPKLEALAGDFKKLSDASTAEEQRKASLPKAAADYKVELAEGFKLPDGAELDLKSPGWGQLAELAHKNGLSQDVFRKLATAHVGVQLQAQTAQREAIAADFKQKLGDTSDARITATHEFLRGVVGDEAAKAVAQCFIKPELVQAFEKLQGALSSAGITSFSHAGREPAKDPSVIDGYEKMSFVEKFRNRNRPETKSAA